MNNRLFKLINNCFFKNKRQNLHFQSIDNQQFVLYLLKSFNSFLIRNSISFLIKNSIKNSAIKKAFNCFFNLKNNAKRYFNNAILMLPFLIFILIPPSVFGQKNTPTTVKKEAKTAANFNGTWSGKGTVDYGFGSRTEFEYELILEQKKDGTITGVSVTFLTIEGKRYCAKALVEGKANKTYLNCAEKYNITEDKLPDSGWIPFVKMELILKNEGTTLEGLYECSDKSNGRIILKRKPPQV
jgi:hypothetical protein